MEADMTIVSAINADIRKNDVSAVKKLLQKHPELLNYPGSLGTWMHIAAVDNLVDMIEMLVDLGMDVNIKNTMSNYDATPLHKAAIRNSLEAARWLLAHGADIHASKDMNRPPLNDAIVSKSLDMVKLMVENGADVNFPFIAWEQKTTPLSWAKQKGTPEIVEYLKSKGALMPDELPSSKSSDDMDEQLRKKVVHQPKAVMTYQEDADAQFIDHMAKMFGPVNPIAMRELIPGGLNLAIYTIPPHDDIKYQTLFTVGMSQHAIKAPFSLRQYQYCELMLYLPADWPLDEKSLAKEKYYWPIEWLKIMAHYPHEIAPGEFYDNGHIASNGDPAEAFGPGTKFCAWMLLHWPDRGCFKAQTGKTISVFEMHPLYESERDYVLKHSYVDMIEMFSKNNVSQVIDIKRKKVC